MVLGWLPVLGLGGVLAWQVLPRQQPQGRRERTGEALRDLEERYAKREIDRDEFEERRRTLLAAPRQRERSPG